MTQLLGGSGRVIVGNQSFPNSWVEPGRTLRQVTCVVCLDTGRTLTDDGSLGELCDCTYGEGITNQWCTAVEPSTGWRCVLRLGEHTNPELHQSGSGGHMHHFYSRETA